jgi:hypothetical protein
VARYRRALGTASAALLACVAITGCSLVPGAKPTVPATPKPRPAPGFAADQKVAAKWTDGNYYLATVSNVEGDRVSIVFADDSSTKTVKSSELRPIPIRVWAVGDKVLAVWSTGRFFEGVITNAAPPRYTVKWADGTTPSTVTADRIMAVP